MFSSPPLFIQALSPIHLKLALLQLIKNNELIFQNHQRNHLLQNSLKTLALVKQRAENHDFFFKAQNLNFLKGNINDAIKIEEQNSSLYGAQKALPQQRQQSIQETLLSMVNFFVYEFGKISAPQVSDQRNKYLDNPTLIDLFDILMKKYQSSSKCREDMIRFVLRKALGSMRDRIRDRKILSAKAASVELCQRYFKEKLEQLTVEHVDITDEDALLNFLLPYKKQSRNKTANSCFITEIFSSDLFYQDYLQFLGKIEKLLEDDNQKKIQKFINFLEICVKENRLSKITTYKRLPWQKTWLHSTKIIANELLSMKPKINVKKQKM